MIDSKATTFEELHIPDYNIFDGLITILNGYQEVRDKVCEGIYDLNVPVFSDFVGAYGGETIDKSNLFTVIGSIARGIWVEGSEEALEGVLQIAADPLKLCRE